MTLGSILLIANPAAGRGRVHRILPEIQAACRSMGIAFDLKYTEAPNHATEIAREASRQGYGLVAAVGGDGTVSEAGAGLVGSDTPLALLPAGTGNDFARVLGLHRNLPLALRALREGSIRSIDAGRFGPHFFLNSVGVGFDGLVAYSNREIRRLRGFLSYFVVVLRHLPTYRNPSFTLRGRDWIHRGKGMMVEVGNGKCAGGGILLTPDADLHDGMLDIAFLGDYGPIRRFVTLPSFFFRRIDSIGGCRLFRTDVLSISVDRPLYIHVDGNVHRMNEPFTAEVIPSALRVLFPPVAP